MFRFYAGETHIRYIGTTGDAITIDSQMNVRFEFGYVSALNLKEGWVVRLKPEDAGLSTDSNLPPDLISPVMTLTEFYFNGIVVRGMPKLENPEEEAIGNGILLDASSGPIIYSKMFIYEMNTADIGIYLKGNCNCNWIDAPMVHGCNIAIQIGETGATITPSTELICPLITSGYQDALEPEYLDRKTFRP